MNKARRAGWPPRGVGGRSLARALIAFHLATAHEQNARENEEKIITSTSFRDCPDLGRSERQRAPYRYNAFLLFFQRASFPEGGREAAAGGEGPK